MDQDIPSSVRVDVGAGLDGPEPDAPKLDEPGRTVGAAAILGVAALVALIAIVFVALRPERGETAAGTQRQDTTTTTSTATSTTDADAAETLTGEGELPPAVSLRVNDVTGTSVLDEVVAGGIGYFGLEITPAADGTPPLFRSIDGISWQRVETEVVEQADATGGEIGRSARYQALRNDFVRGGFTILRSREIPGEPDRIGNGVEVIDQLVSDLGDTWTVDPDFEPIETGDSFPFVYPDGSVAVISFEEGLDTSSELVPLTALLNQTMVNPPSDPVCFADREFPTAELILVACNFGTSIPDSITAEDLLVPADVEAVFSCAEELGDGFRGALAFYFLGSSPDPFIAERILTPPSRVGNGTVVAIGAAIPDFGPSSCDQFDLDRPAPRETSLLRWNQPGASEVVSLAGDFGEATFEFIEGDPVAGDQEFFVVAGDTIWRIDVDGNVEVVVEISNRPGLALYGTSVGGETVFAAVSEGELLTWTIPFGSSRVEEASFPLTAGYRGTVLYLDEQIIIFDARGGGLRTIVRPNDFSSLEE